MCKDMEPLKQRGQFCILRATRPVFACKYQYLHFENLSILQSCSKAWDHSATRRNCRNFQILLDCTVSNGF